MKRAFLRICLDALRAKILMLRVAIVEAKDHNLQTEVESLLQYHEAALADLAQEVRPTVVLIWVLVQVELHLHRSRGCAKQGTAEEERDVPLHEGFVREDACQLRDCISLPLNMNHGQEAD